MFCFSFSCFWTGAWWTIFFGLWWFLFWGRMACCRPLGLNFEEGFPIVFADWLSWNTFCCGFCCFRHFFAFLWLASFDLSFLGDFAALWGWEGCVWSVGSVRSTHVFEPRCTRGCHHTFCSCFQTVSCRQVCSIVEVSMESPSGPRHLSWMALCSRWKAIRRSLCSGWDVSQMCRA